MREEVHYRICTCDICGKSERAYSEVCVLPRGWALLSAKERLTNDACPEEVTFDACPDCVSAVKRFMQDLKGEKQGAAMRAMQDATFF